MQNEFKFNQVNTQKSTETVDSSLLRALQHRLRAFGPYLYLMPALAMVGGLLLYSAVQTVIVSFTDWDLITAPQFIGLQNYIDIVRDPTFGQAFGNTLYWTGGSLLLPVGGGLLLAVLLENLPGQHVLKVLIYLPATLAAVVVSTIWSYIYALHGIANEALHSIGLAALEQAWLVKAPTNTFAMILASTWRGLGPSMVLFLVGLQTIPVEIVEAAKIDGAGGWNLFQRIKLPLLRPIAAVVVTMSVINSFTTFDIVWVMTHGGPGTASATLAVTMYRQAFVLWKMGYAAGVAVILSLIVLAFSATYLRPMFKRNV